MSITYATLPSPSVTAGPLWAQMINNLFTGDSQTGAVGLVAHRHEGTDENKVRPAGMTIDATLPMNGNALTGVSQVGLSTAGSLAANTLYQSGGDLYYYTGIGSAVKITAGTTLNGGGVANGFLGNYSVSGAADYEASTTAFSFYNVHSAYTDANLTQGRWGSLEVKAPGAYVTTVPTFRYHEGGAANGGWAQYSPSNTGWAVAFDSTTSGTYADVGLALAPTIDASAPHMYALAQNGLSAGNNWKATFGAKYNSTGVKNTLNLGVDGHAGVQNSWGAALGFAATDSSSNYNPQASIVGYWADAGTTKGGLLFRDQAGATMLSLDSNLGKATFAGTVSIASQTTATSFNAAVFTNTAGGMQLTPVGGDLQLTAGNFLLPTGANIGGASNIVGTTHERVIQWYNGTSSSMKTQRDGVIWYAVHSDGGATPSRSTEYAANTTPSAFTRDTTGVYSITLPAAPSNPVVFVQAAEGSGTVITSTVLYGGGGLFTIRIFENGSPANKQFNFVVLSAGF